MPSSISRRDFTLWMVSALAAGCSRSNADIFEAAQAGDSKRINELLSTSPKLANATNAEGLRPINLAASGGKAGAVMTLSSRGADLNAGSPLLDACGAADAAVALDMVTTLAGNNAEVNIAGPDGRTPLHIAAERGHHLVCWMLIHRGANWNVVDRRGRRPVDVAIGAAAAVLQNAGMIEVIYPHARFRTDQAGRPFRPAAGFSAPWEAVNEFVTSSHTSTSDAKDVLAKHPGVLHARATFDELAVEAAAHLGNLDWCAELVDRGSPYSICTAAALGDVAAVRMMLLEDPNRLRERGPHDQALLCYTAFGEPREEIASLLLDAGANVDSRGLGQTVLHFAVRRGHIELARLLLANGADANAPSWSRIVPGTPLELARKAWKFARQEMIDLLVSHGAR